MSMQLLALLFLIFLGFLFLCTNDGGRFSVFCTSCSSGYIAACLMDIWHHFRIKYTDQFTADSNLFLSPFQRILYTDYIMIINSTELLVSCKQRYHYLIPDLSVFSSPAFANPGSPIMQDLKRWFKTSEITHLSNENCYSDASYSFNGV